MPKVIIADKSSYTRIVLQDILGEEEDVDVVGVAADGDSLLNQLMQTNADLAIVDIDLPQNSRLLALKRIFSEVPVPVILILSYGQLSFKLVEEAVALGVYAIIIKQGSEKYPSFRGMKDELVAKVKAFDKQDKRDMLLLAQSLEMEHKKAHQYLKKTLATAETVIVIGASTGGTQAIETIVRSLSPNLKACVLLAVHLPARFTKSFAKRLQELTPLTVEEGKDGLLLKPGKLIVAPGGRRMEVQPVMGNSANLKVCFSEDGTGPLDLPSIDALMASVAKSTVKNIVGVILTGMGKDGTLGANLIKSRNGIVLAQDEATSAIFGMAKSAIDSGCINQVLPLAQIPVFINNYVAEQQQVSVTGGIA
ncbi:chemotaxis protein CheB [Pontibacter harenae]|uniref:chemotaxis protein CheB n=1 Tax=Pontibacter harenae TaxID=2894083 RepID=UPI001E2CA87E|nr:chemotaxis protein CheB [Pontibacter harenae]MCC9165544.1 chemotaxis protein CheB [Pontibacter harenae]